MRSSSAFLVVILVVLAVVMGELSGRVDATSRVLLEKRDFNGGDYLESYASAYEQTRLRMAGWLQRLASGPSPRGPGH
ncbi:hypothetical protein QQ045_017253 [Rhodiola kirilowii]